jgi:hypothetical protein
VWRDVVARGSASPFDIVLTAEERGELERRARSYTAPYGVVVRAKIVLLAADGHANVDIAARCDTSPQVVSRWRKRFFEQRLKGLEDAPRSGRPRVFSPLGQRRDQSVGVRTSRHHRCAVVSVEFRRVSPRTDDPGGGGGHLGGDGVADAAG